MSPAASVCGLYWPIRWRAISMWAASTAGKYKTTLTVGFTLTEMERWLAPNLGYGTARDPESHPREHRGHRGRKEGVPDPGPNLSLLTSPISVISVDSVVNPDTLASRSTRQRRCAGFVV